MLSGLTFKFQNDNFHYFLNTITSKMGQGHQFCMKKYIKITCDQGANSSTVT